MRVLTGYRRRAADDAELIDEKGRAISPAQGAEIHHNATRIKECQRVNVVGVRRISNHLTGVVDESRVALFSSQCAQVQELATAVEKSVELGVVQQTAASDLAGSVDGRAS